MASYGGGGKEWLVTYAEDIVQYLDPVKAVMHLRMVCREGFDEEDQEFVLQKHTTSRERSEALLSLLDKRPPEVIEEFRRIVMRSHRLSSIIQPVRYRVLWLCQSAQHAAMAGHVLEQFSETKFPSPEDGGPNFLVRREYAFGEEDVLIKLAFPIKPEHFSDMLTETVQQRDEERIHLAVLTGGCDATVPTAPVGQVVIPASAANDAGDVINCSTADRVKALRRNLQGRVREARWISELTEPGPYRESGYLDYCSARLGRLYAELHSGWSTWLAEFGWDKGADAQSEVNRACLSAQFPDWGSGRLARYLLKERQTWKTDPTSPLGLAPKHDLLSRIIERKCWYNEFPSQIECTPHGPFFNPLSTPGYGGDVTDKNTYQFYRTCSHNLEPGIPWLSCLCVCHDAVSSSHELTAFTAVTMAMEVVQLIRSVY